MGAVLRNQPVQTTWEIAKAALEEAKIPVAVTALTDTARDIRCAGVEHMAVVIGSEGQGVRREVMAAAGQALIIPMNERCESLNAALAAAIVAWEMKQV